MILNVKIRNIHHKKKSCHYIISNVSLTIMFSGTGARKPKSERKLNPVSAGTDVRLVGKETMPGVLGFCSLLLLSIRRYGPFY